ncbi:MAG TPA: HEAT repeat domain-containing protein [Terriglobales bacterium]|jgi:HEAT repeat protein
MRRAIIHVFGLAIFASGILGCFKCVAQAPPTLEAELNRYGVPLTAESLHSALRDERPEVRSLAASELASMKDARSVPLIVQALEGEKNAQVKFNMAAALLSLHSTAGTTVLSDICDDKSEPKGHRLDAASRLVNAGDFRCLSSILDIMEMTRDSSLKASALLIVAHVKPVPASFVPRIHVALLASLQDQNSAVRQDASKCIAAVGDKAAIFYLQTAIANESDESTRKYMEQSLSTLEREP